MTMQVPASSSLTSREIIAIVIRAEKDNGPTVVDLATQIAKGARAGLKTADIDIRMGPEGFNSEALDEYLSSLRDYGYASKDSPLELEPKGDALLLSLITRAYSAKKQEVENWARVLGVPVTSLLRAR